MRRVRCVAAVLLVWLGAALGADPSRAASIRYQAVDLPDYVPGQDDWLYYYSLEVGPEGFPMNQGFAIEFDPGLYGSLQSGPGPFDMLVLQPDLELPAPGIFDGLATYDLEEGDAAVFVVNFSWLGGPATPGSQPYSLYQLDDSGFVTVIGTGTTVPEPATTALLAVVAGVLAARRARARRKEGSS